MSLFRHLVHGLRALFRPRTAETELRDEVDYYLAETAADYRRQGLDPENALRRARLDLGGTTAMQEEIRSYGWERAFTAFLADMCYGLRGLVANKGFALVAIGTLALGIGASTSIFSLVDSVLLRSLPFRQPNQLVRLWEQAPDGRRMNFADPNFDDFQSQNNTFSNLSAYSAWPTAVAGGSEPANVVSAVVSANFFSTLGISPFRGRTFDAAESRLHGAPAAVVSHSYWQRYLSSRFDLENVRLRIEGEIYPVVGVMPAGFDFPEGSSVWLARERNNETPSRSAHNWRAFGRLQPGVSFAGARANLDAIASRIHRQFPKDADLNAAAVVPLQESLVGDVRAALLTMLAAVCLLLLVACANVAGLLLARTSARRKELALRLALGAGRLRLAQQFLAESLVLSLPAGLLGLLFARWGVWLLPAVLPASVPLNQGIQMSLPVLLFALAVTLSIAIALGLFASWRSRDAGLQEALTTGARSDGGASHRSRGTLVIAEVAVTLVLLTGAALLSRSFLRLASTNPGFNLRRLLAVEFSRPDQPRAVEELMARVRALPGIDSAALASALPAANGDNLPDGTFLILNGQPAPTTLEQWDRIAAAKSQTGHALYAAVDQNYFRALDVPLLRGRPFNSTDTPGAAHVAIISQTLARQRWPHADPIGQSIFFGNMDGDTKPMTIVGVAADVRAQGLDLPPAAVIYVDLDQRNLVGSSSPVILFRAAAPVSLLAPSLRRIFHEVAPDTPIKISTFGEELGGWLAERRFLLLLVGLFAGTALLLAAVGIYGTIAFLITRRTREIGVRVALGASRATILRMVLSEGARLSLVGVLLGLILSFALSRWIANLLFGIGATDPVAFTLAPALLIVIALCASYIPARRAMRLDPNTALRYE